MGRRIQSKEEVVPSPNKIITFVPFGNSREQIKREPVQYHTFSIAQHLPFVCRRF